MKTAGDTVTGSVVITPSTHTIAPACEVPAAHQSFVSRTPWVWKLPWASVSG